MLITELKDGDLLFMRDPSALSEGIRKSTGEYSHVGIFFTPFFYHASHKKGVTKESLTDFLNEEPHSIFVYRYPNINAAAVKSAAEKLLGLPYNESFYPNGTGLYCSQFIAKILPIFKTVRMEFGDGKKAVSDYWKAYYAALGVPVPLKKEGTNPSALSASPLLEYKGSLEL